MSVAQSRGLRKLGRTVLQWVASIGTTGLTVALANSLGVEFGAAAAIAFQAFWMFVYTYAQNALETAGKIPVLLPSPGLVSAVLAPVHEAVSDITPIIAPVAAATVDAVVAPTGQVVGAVTDLGGETIGTVTGEVPPNDNNVEI